MKKIISLFLVFIFSFTMISTSTQKKAEAIATTLIAGYTISQILGAMALSATVVGAGYAISDTLVNPEDNSEFTEFLQTVFQETLNMQKHEIPPPPEPLSNLESATLLSMLTKQGIEVGTELYNKVYDYFINTSSSGFQPESFVNGMPFIHHYVSSPGAEYYQVSSTNTNKFYLSNNRVYATEKVYQYFKPNPESSYTMQIIQPHQILVAAGNMFAYGYNLNAPIYTDISLSKISTDFTYRDFVPEVTIDNVLPPEEMVNPDEYVPIFKNIDMSPLNGIVKNPQELIDIINGVKKVPAYVYGKITTAFNDIYDNFLANPNFIGADEPLTPTIEPTTGTLYFGDPKLDEPGIDNDPMPDELSALNKALFWLKGIWQSIRDLPKNIAIEIGNIFRYLKNFIERFWQSFTEWWENNFLYHWTLFIDWLHTLPNLISEALKPLFDNLMIPVNGIVSLLQNIWDWLQGFPDMLLGLIIPPDNSIAEVWEPVSDLFNQKIFPVIQPFQNIGFYEEELQDISADIKIGQYQGNHKIIDYSYLKSVREPIKSVIRSFFWILIIFFNLDQVHRLIRNQSIVKTYIRKVDEPGGNK